MEHVGSIIQGLASIAWPLIIIAAIFFFRNNIKELLASAKSRKVTVKVGDNELTLDEASEQQHTLIIDLQEQIVEIKKTLETLKSTQPTKAKPEIVSSKQGFDSAKSILWVDDNPRNNAYLIESLSKLGINVVTSLSTADALTKIDNFRFDRIISDMGRTESGHRNDIAGIELIKQIRQKDKNIPIIIFTSSRAARNFGEEARQAGAKEVTSSSTMLMNALDLDV